MFRKYIQQINRLNEQCKMNINLLLMHVCINTVVQMQMSTWEFIASEYPIFHVDTGLKKYEGVEKGRRVQESIFKVIY